MMRSGFSLTGHVKIVVLGFTLYWLSSACLASSVDPRELTAVSGPAYNLEQSPSTHVGYQRLTLTLGDAIYISDYEEQSLFVEDNELALQQAIGHTTDTEGEMFYIFAIPGQKPDAYIGMGNLHAINAIFRNSTQPPFDWRAVAFQKMRLLVTHKETTDQALILDVWKTLKEGTPAIMPSYTPDFYAHPDSPKSLHSVEMYSNQLPGFIYHIGVYTDAAGQVYLAENVNSYQWIPASQLFTEWYQTR